MKVCIIGTGITSLTLAKALINRGIHVDVIDNKKHKILDKKRTIGISKTNIEYFNSNIMDIEKIQWGIKKIKVFTENFLNKEILNFSNPEKFLFSTLKNYELYRLLDVELRKSKIFQYKNNPNLKNLIKKDYTLIINCDFNNEITRKFFSNKIKKNYRSYAYTTIINHKKIKQNFNAVQIFTNNGPIAFLPISEDKTSVVCSLRQNNYKEKKEIENLIRKFNPNYQIKKIEKIFKFELKSSNLREYYKDNILAFGDLLHKIHPLAGQGFNMTMRDIRNLLGLIDKRINLGLEIDHSICIDFQNKTKDKNLLFSEGIDLIYEFFYFESKIKSNLLNETLSKIGKNKLFNNFLKKYADQGLIV